MLETEILNLSRQDRSGGLSPWFGRNLSRQIERGLFLPPDKLRDVQERITARLEAYRRQAGVSTAVLGMSGGVDSALTAALFKAAGWRVIGLTLPIHQNPDETARGVEACTALGLEHLHLDLTPQYDRMVAAMAALDPAMATADDEPRRTRRGNLRARLRMAALYDQAHRHGGIVASTDNFSELGAGFWTLHGDVGDLAPVQGLLKSWEVPWLARHAGVPEATWRAKPTDGLGIGAGDEEQIGASYLEWDIALFALDRLLGRDGDIATGDLPRRLKTGGDDHAEKVLAAILSRLGGSWHKRINPIAFDHPLAGRLAMLDRLDARLFRPKAVLPQAEGEAASLASALCAALGRSGLKVVTAESCTAGLLAAGIAKVPGSGGQLEGSFVTYAPSMKIDTLGVPEDLIEARTVYDPAVAAAMASGALTAAPGAGLSLAVTGVGGPDEDQGKPAGYVCIAAALRGRPPLVREFRFDGDPQAVLASAIRAALQLGLSALDTDAEATQ